MSGPTKHPSLLTLTPDYPPSLGGIQLLLQRLLERLPRWEHRVVARGPGGRAVPGAIDRTRLQSGFESIVELNARGLARGLITRPAVILNAHVTTAPAAELLSRATGAPVVTYLFADEMTAWPRLTRRAMKTTDRSIAISTYTRDLAIAFGADPARMALILPGVDPPHSVERRNDGRPPTIVTVARLADRYKGHDVMLDALPIVRESIGEVRWIVVGDGPLRHELQSRAHHRGLSDVVMFVGRVSDAARDGWLSEADAFAMPSRLPPSGHGGEGFGIVYLEAALHGLPVVAGDKGGAVDAVRDGETGLLVDAARADAVAAALIKLLGNPAAAVEMGAAGRSFAATFTWARMADEVDAVLRDAARARTPRRDPTRSHRD